MRRLLRQLHYRHSGVACMEYGAVFDATGRYRYSLWRAWSNAHPRIVFIMLNPSTADNQRNDPTIRRCIGFARAWKFGSVEVVNLFAYRATDVRELSRVDDPIGEENERFIIRAIKRCSILVVAWGEKGALRGRDRQVIRLFDGRQDVYCLGVTKSGHPRHPLYVRGDMRLVSFC